MADPSFSTTNASLLARLGNETVDQKDWAEFIDRYGPSVYRWCRGRKLQQADAEEVTQQVLAKLVLKMRSFRYDESRSFRAYVRTLSRYALSDFLDSRNRPGALGSGGDAVFDLLNSEVAREELQERLAEAFDLELFEMAKARVRARVEPKTWEAFRLTAIEGLSGLEAAGRAGMSLTAAFKAKSKVQKMIREEVDRLRIDEEEG
jgi:RNA polymerase sigma factor (sigma-70 family)